MFYVSNISGNLVPFDPRTTPISSVVQVVAAVPEVLSTPSSPQAANTPAPANQNAQVATQPEEAALYEGHSNPNTSELASALADKGSLSRAGAAMAYNIQQADSPSESPPVDDPESIEPALPIASVDSQPGEAPGRVNPIKRANYKYQPPKKERKRVVVAADIMSSPVFTLTDEAMLEDAQVVFKKRRFRHIPILSADKKLVGILSDRDFIGAPPLDMLWEISIKDRMVTNILTARPQTEVREVADVMIGHRIGCLPIVDEQAKLVGIITRSDILRAIVNHAPIELWT